MAEIPHSILTGGDFIVEVCLLSAKNTFNANFVELKLVQSFVKTICLLCDNNLGLGYGADEPFWN